MRVCAAVHTMYTNFCVHVVYTKGENLAFSAILAILVSSNLQISRWGESYEEYQDRHAA